VIKMDEVLNKGLDKVYPGAVLLIGNLDREDTIYDLASLTKVVTTISIMILLSRKEISLWDNVSNYIENIESGEGFRGKF